MSYDGSERFSDSSVCPLNHLSLGRRLCHVGRSHGGNRHGLASDKTRQR